MTHYEEYREIFEKEILQKSKGIIFEFLPLNETYTYKPYCHGLSGDAVEKLGELMRYNLFFYCFGEDEVVEHYKKGDLLSLQAASKYAYINRLPHRLPDSDGLPGEVLLDLLIELYNPNAYKLSVRTILRQDDNNEIKGYDLTYFTKDSTEISLWLGQAKLGSKEYCKGSIDKDLLEKYVEKYLTKQIYFLADKRICVTEEAKSIIDVINDINIHTISYDDDKRAKELLDCFNKHNITFKIPCLLAYDEDKVYKDGSSLYNRIAEETEGIKNYFNRKKYAFSGFVPEIIFYVFPIQSVNRLRDERTGFYAGLR